MKFSKFICQASLALLVFCGQTMSNPLAAQVIFGDHAHHDDEAEPIPLSPPFQQTFNITASSPSVKISTQPSDDATSMYYSPIAPFRSDLQPTAHLSAYIWIQNTGNGTIYLEKVVGEWMQNGQKKTKVITLETLDTIPANTTGKWGNARDYNSLGNTFYFDQPIPTSITFLLYFKNYAAPVKFTRTLKPYTRTFNFPLKAGSLAGGEYYFGGSSHVGGSQVFGYDLGAVAFNAENKLTRLRPNTNGTKNEHHRIYGDSVFAMADGIVTFSMNDCPTNPAPNVKLDRTDIPNSGGGNAFKIRHGDVIALYAHMIEGSLNPDLLPVGSRVKQGDFLGLVGNSGNSDGPHLHIHITKEGSTIRPLLFNYGMVIEAEPLPANPATAKWAKVNGRALPGYGNKRPLIYPANYVPSLAKFKL